MSDETKEKSWNSLSELLRDRRCSLGLTHRQIESRTAGSGPVVVNRGAYGRIEGNFWNPKNPNVLIAIARALQLDEKLVLELSERTRNAPMVLNKEYGRVLQLMQAMVSVMDKAEQALTIRTLDQKIGLFQEPIHQLARNFVDLWKGDLRVDEVPRNGLRPLIHYLRPFCDEDMKP